MVSQLASRLQNFATVRNTLFTLAMLIIFNLLFSYAFQGLEGRIADTKLWYSSEKVYALLESYTDDEKQQYRKGMIALDFIYPLVYGLLLLLLLQRTKAPVIFFLFPLSAMLFDYLENSFILVMLTLLPQKLAILGSLSGIFTLTKWLSVFITACIIVIYFAKGLLNRNQRSEASV